MCVEQHLLATAGTIGGELDSLEEREPCGAGTVQIIATSNIYSDKQLFLLYENRFPLYLIQFSCSSCKMGIFIPILQM